MTDNNNTTPEIQYMDPMSAEELTKYATFIVEHMDNDKVVDEEATAFMVREDNTPCEEDQITILQIIEEIYNGQQDSKNTGGESPRSEEIINTESQADSCEIDSAKDEAY